MTVVTCPVHVYSWNLLHIALCICKMLCSLLNSDLYLVLLCRRSHTSLPPSPWSKTSSSFFFFSFISICTNYAYLKHNNFNSAEFSSHSESFSRRGNPLDKQNENGVIDRCVLLINVIFFSRLCFRIRR